MRATRKRYDTLQALLSPEANIMARWKGEQRGSIKRTATGWHGKWREYQERDGAVEWRQTGWRKLCDLADGKGRAIEVLNEKLAVANGPAAVPQGVATLAQFIEVRFRPDHVASLKASGRDHYEWALGHIVPELGHHRMREISQPMVQMWLTGKVKKGLASQTIRHLRNALSAVLGHAKGLGMWRGDLPTDMVRTPEVRHKAGVALESEQVTALLCQLAEPYRALVLPLASTGLRIGEALALDWEHCNIEESVRRLGNSWLPGRTIAVRRNWTHGEMGTLKTNNSVRNVPVTDEVAAALELHREPGPWGWLVFPNRCGRPLDAHNIAARHLKPACVAAGVPRIGWHALRHTALTLMDQQGMSATEKRLIAGHGSERVTERYTHGFLDRARGLMPKVTSEVVN